MVRNKSASAKETESSVEFYCEKNGSVIIKRLVYYTDQQNITLDTRRRVLINNKDEISVSTMRIAFSVWNGYD
ncbi:hypothetical protein T10_9525 [Trichinella papuae]|uniref:Uncharacterized protein n=1 Tax=Trichinella papuae TaxID=268474 RepID=A0A0V1MZP7_9BILA|nr:hypothetical protein T10_9525 [Trichinella papuae]